tara:strand:+ start:9692 stop:10018 length:327 start_codon:yes stop_codon:yes gene_type:complete
MKISKLQIQVDEWIKKYGVRYFNELTNMAILTEEVGELASIIARKYGEQSFKKEDSHDLGSEMADILFVLLCLANQTNINLEKYFNDKIKYKTKRDLQRHKKNKKINL